MTPGARRRVARTLVWAAIAAAWALPLAIGVQLARDVSTWRTADLAGASARLVAGETPARHAPTRPATDLEPPDGTGRPVFAVFGESTLAFEPGLQQDFLDEALAPLDLGVDLAHYAEPGATSRAIRGRVESVLDRYDARGRPPAAIVLYAGHNDLTSNFAYGLTPPLRFRRTVRWLWRLPLAWRRGWSEGGGYEWFERTAGASLGRAAQQLGVVGLPDDPFPGAKAAIHDAWIAEVEAIVRRARASGALVVVYVPVGNLEREPFGPLRTTHDVWSAALAETDPGRRAAALARARDAEVLTPDLRADSDLQRRIRALDAPDVLVVDLQQDWEARELRFDDRLFVDWVHLSIRGFRELADTTARALAARPDVVERLRADLSDGPG